jgi:hypothetical protein
MTAESRTTDRKRPFELVPTNLKGVYSFVPPPKGVDLTTASRRTLIRHGVLMRRPDPEREPKLFAQWKKFVGEIWTEENFVVPTFGPPSGMPHNLRGLQPTETNGVFNSHNWSGCMVVGNWVGVMGVWQVPAVSLPLTPAATAPNGWSGWQSASWVGLNGGGMQLDGSFLPGTSSQDVLQAGVAQNIDIYIRDPHIMHGSNGPLTASKPIKRR